MTRLFDVAYLTSTPEAVAILWHGVFMALPFVVGAAFAIGRVLRTARQARHSVGLSLETREAARWRERVEALSELSEAYRAEAVWRAGNDPRELPMAHSQAIDAARQRVLATMAPFTARGQSRPLEPVPGQPSTFYL